MDSLDKIMAETQDETEEKQAPGSEVSSDSFEDQDQDLDIEDLMESVESLEAGIKVMTPPRKKEGLTTTHDSPDSLQTQIMALESTVTYLDGHISALKCKIIEVTASGAMTEHDLEVQISALQAEIVAVKKEGVDAMTEMKKNHEENMFSIHKESETAILGVKKVAQQEAAEANRLANDELRLQIGSIEEEAFALQKDSEQMLSTMEEEFTKELMTQETSHKAYAFESEAKLQMNRETEITLMEKLEKAENRASLIEHQHISLKHKTRISHLLLSTSVAHGYHSMRAVCIWRWRLARTKELEAAKTRIFRMEKKQIEEQHLKQLEKQAAKIEEGEKNQEQAIERQMLHQVALERINSLEAMREEDLVDFETRIRAQETIYVGTVTQIQEAFDLKSKLANDYEHRIQTLEAELSVSRHSSDTLKNEIHSEIGKNMAAIGMSESQDWIIDQLVSSIKTLKGNQIVLEDEMNITISEQGDTVLKLSKEGKKLQEKLAKLTDKLSEQEHFHHIILEEAKQKAAAEGRLEGERDAAVVAAALRLTEVGELEKALILIQSAKNEADKAVIEVVKLKEEIENINKDTEEKMTATKQEASIILEAVASEGEKMVSDVNMKLQGQRDAVRSISTGKMGKLLAKQKAKVLHSIVLRWRSKSSRDMIHVARESMEDEKRAMTELFRLEMDCTAVLKTQATRGNAIDRLQRVRAYSVSRQVQSCVKNWIYQKRVDNTRVETDALQHVIALKALRRMAEREETVTRVSHVVSSWQRNAAVSRSMQKSLCFLTVVLVEKIKAQKTQNAAKLWRSNYYQARTEHLVQQEAALMKRESAMSEGAALVLHLTSSRLISGILIRVLACEKACELTQKVELWRSNLVQERQMQQLESTKCRLTISLDQVSMLNNELVANQNELKHVQLNLNSKLDVLRLIKAEMKKMKEGGRTGGEETDLQKELGDAHSELANLSMELEDTQLQLQQKCDVLRALKDERRKEKAAYRTSA